MAFTPFLLPIIIASCALSSTANKSYQTHVIYVDPTNGTTDISCWSRGLVQPCQNLEIALEGAKQIKDSAVMTLHPTSIQASISLIKRVDRGNNCPTWMNFNVASDKCECGKSVHDIVRCNDTLNEVSILDCYLMTLDDELGQMIVGRSFYGCGRGATYRKDKIYYKVPSNKTQINDIMCNHFN